MRLPEFHIQDWKDTVELFSEGLQRDCTGLYSTAVAINIMPSGQQQLSCTSVAWRCLLSRTQPLQVLDQPGYCLHVRLTACQGIGMHAKAETLGGPLSEPRNLEQPEPVELLSGFVSLEQMADAIERSQRSLVIFRKQSEALLTLKGPGVLQNCCQLTIISWPQGMHQ